MHRTPPLIFDPAAAQAWLHQPSNTHHGLTRADILDHGALITVDLANGLRLCTLHQDIKDFADRDQHGIPAVLSALAHIANQASLLVAAYHAANPPAGSEVSR